MTHPALTEDAIQIQCAKWLELAYPVDGPVLWHHSPNAHSTGKGAKVREMLLRFIQKLLRMGMRPGWPDLEFSWEDWEDCGNSYCDHCGPSGRGISRFALFELKKPGGRLSPAQRGIRDWAKQLGVPWGMGESADDLQAFLRGIPGFPAPRGGW